MPRVGRPRKGEHRPPLARKVTRLPPAEAAYVEAFSQATGESESSVLLRAVRALMVMVPDPERVARIKPVP